MVIEHQFLKLRPQSKLILPEIIAKGTPFENKWVENLPAEEYHADKTALSSTGLRLLLNESPKHFKSYWSGALEEETEKKHFRFGRLAHTALLEPNRFLSSYIVMPEFTGFTKKGKPSTRSADVEEKRQEWLLAQPDYAIVVTQKEYDQLTSTVESILTHEIARNLLKNGQMEVSGWAMDPVTGMKLRGRIDCLTPDPDLPSRVHLVDFKTTRDASIGMFAKSIADFQYFVQMAYYWYIVELITGQPPLSATIIATESEGCFDTAVYYLNDEDIQEGMRLVRHGIDTLVRCIKLDLFPGKQREAQLINMPSWSKNQPLPHFDFGQEES